MGPGPLSAIDSIHHLSQMSNLSISTPDDNATDAGSHLADVTNFSADLPFPTGPGPLNPDFIEIHKISANHSSAMTDTKDPLGDTNWTQWKRKMLLIFKMCGVLAYSMGEIECPDKFEYPLEAEAWEFNDSYTSMLIINNISSSEMFNVNECTTSHQMWTSLRDVHEERSTQTIIARARNFWRITADEGDDIISHLTRLRQARERINMAGHKYKIDELTFKFALSHSLPLSWDSFTEKFVNSDAFNEEDSSKAMSSQQFIGLIKEEYLRCKDRQTTHDALNAQTKRGGKRGNNNNRNRENGNLFCKYCKRTNHKTDDCRLLQGDRCTNCDKLGHKAADCWSGNGNKSKKRGNDAVEDKSRSKKRRNESYKADKSESDKEESDHVAFIADAHIEPMDEDPFIDVPLTDDDIYQYSLNSTTAINDRSTYDWLADSGTTSHITNDRQLFKTYCPIISVRVSGVGNSTTYAIGKGTIVLRSTVGNEIHTLELQDVLHVPQNKHSLLSLGRWEQNGRSYHASCGTLKLLLANNKIIAEGHKYKDSLYKIQLFADGYSPTPSLSLEANTKDQDWMTWHKRFGHIGFSGLRKLINDNLVDGMSVDRDSPVPVCDACIAGKHSVHPFGDSRSRAQVPGQITHLDLWGKYDVTSIHGNSYYMLAVDDATRHVTIYFLKSKAAASERVQNYLAHISVRHPAPQAIMVDRGGEFLNEGLRTWCASRGIDIHTTAPYSPAQNGIAERFNRTLVELARTMLADGKLPEFLWEPAVAHAAYVRNRAYTKAVDGATPHERWTGKRPNVSHLREFGAPVWIKSCTSVLTTALSPYATIARARERFCSPETFETCLSPLRCRADIAMPSKFVPSHPVNSSRGSGNRKTRH